MKGQINIKQAAENHVEKAVLAQAIVDLSAAAKALAKSGLNKYALVVLLAHETALPLRSVRAVLDALEDAKHKFTVLP